MPEIATSADPSSLNLVSFLGLVVMVGLAWLMSSHKARVNWRLVVTGLVFQLILGAIFFNSQNWTFGGKFENGILFYVFDSFFAYVTEWTEAGSGFVFYADVKQGEPLFLLKTFAFGVLPTVIFFASLMSVLYHVGVMNPIIRAMAWIMQKVLGTSGSESLAAAANVFVGHTEAPLVVKPFIPTMTRSELNAMMVGGFATITGGLMAVFVAKGISAGHLVTASIVSAPAALVIAKIMQPETEVSETLGVVKTKLDKNASNVIEAAAVGASDGMKLAINIGAMLIAFLALIAMCNTVLMSIGEGVEYIINSFQSSESAIDLNWSLTGLLGVVFWPLAYVMGIESGDCAISGQLLGTKMMANEFVAYLDLGKVLGGEMTKTLEDGTEAVVSISNRTEIILTYALCGFSNFGAIGIQLGGIGPLAPNRRSDLAQLGLRAMLGGMIACCMTACVAGLMYGVLS